MIIKGFPLEQKAFWIAVILSQIIIGLIAIIIPVPHVLFLIFLIPLLAVFFSEPILSLLCLIPFLPNYPIPLFSIGEAKIRLIDPFIFLALFSWFFSSLRVRKIRLYSSPIDIAIFLLFSWISLSLIWTPNFPGGVVQIFKIMMGLAIYFLHINIIENKKDFNLILSTWIVMGIFSTIIGFYETVFYGIEAASKLVIVQEGYTKLTRGVRTSAFFLGPDMLGFVLSISIVLVIIKFLITPSKKWRFFFLSSLPLMFFVIVATFSRSTFLGIFAGAIYLSWRSRKIFNTFLGISIIGSLLFLVLGIGGFLDILVNRIETFFMSPAVSISDRVISWRLATQLFSESPIVGNGIAAFVLAARTADIPLQTPHNIYLYVLADFGLIGFMLFLFWGFQIIQSFGKFYKLNRDKSADLISTGIICGFIIVLILAGFRNIGLAEPIFWGFLGLSSAFLKVYTPGKDNNFPILSGAKSIHKEANRG